MRPLLKWTGLEYFTLKLIKYEIMVNQFKILLYYKYISLENPEEVRGWQRGLCERLGLKGRIIVSTEGMNGTVAGEEKNVEVYMEETNMRIEFADMEWKVSYAGEQVFPKLRVVVRDEIVTLGVKKTGTDVDIANRADYIEPEELEKLYENGEDVVLVDARNDYEMSVGKFKNAITPKLDNFRDFPAFVENSLGKYKDKQVVTYCTGGVRCEKASAYLKERGFKKVRQLHGGIFQYGEKTGGKYFEGEMFVFDKRLHVAVNKVNPVVISTCIYCKKSVTRLVDCAAFGCDELFVGCENCELKHLSSCSQICELKVQQRLEKSV